MSTNVGAKFLKIIDDKIPETLKKYFNRNTIKISYCCMPHMKNLIDRHNTKLMKEQNNNNNNNKLGLSCAKLRAQLSSDLGLSLKLARLRAQLR